MTPLIGVGVDIAVVKDHTYRNLRTNSIRIQQQHIQYGPTNDVELECTQFVKDMNKQNLFIINKWL